MERKEATEKVEYGCSLCDSRGERRCCHGCAAYFGYLHDIPKSMVQMYLLMFDEAQGFWRKHTGCILPRKWRSDTCLLYACYMETENREQLRNWLMGKKDAMLPLALGVKIQAKKEVEDGRSPETRNV